MNDCGYVVWLVDNDVLSVSEDMYSEAKAFYSEMDDLDSDYMFGDAGERGGVPGAAPARAGP